MKTATPSCQDYCEHTFAACAGEQATTETLAALAFKPARLEAAEVVAGGDPFLLSLPEAAALLDAGEAATLLGDAEAARHSDEWVPELVSAVGWKARSNGRHLVKLRMMFQPLDIYNSKTLTPEEFEMAALGFNLMNVRDKKRLSGPGQMALLADFGDSTMLYVLPGIYGKAWDSNDFSTELLLTWELTQPELTPAERGNRLLGIAGPQVDALMKTARGSHRGAPATP